ncbi:MAG: hypothetical protein Kow0054_22550 [Deferrisoma sp.]
MENLRILDFQKQDRRPRRRAQPAGAVWAARPATEDRSHLEPLSGPFEVYRRRAKVLPGAGGGLVPAVRECGIRLTLHPSLSRVDGATQKLWAFSPVRLAGRVPVVGRVPDAATVGATPGAPAGPMPPTVSIWSPE